VVFEVYPTPPAVLSVLRESSAAVSTQCQKNGTSRCWWSYMRGTLTRAQPALRMNAYLEAPARASKTSKPQGASAWH